MAVGDRIKRARNLRGMTQKELGIAIGFEEKSADIRIAQYESNTPRRVLTWQSPEYTHLPTKNNRSPRPKRSEVTNTPIPAR